MPNQSCLGLPTFLLQAWDLKWAFVGLGLIWILSWMISIGYLRFETERPRKILPGVQSRPDVLWPKLFDWVR